MSIQFANRTEQMKASEIRESYKLMDVPGMISLSSGSPDPSLYPMDQVKQATMAVLDQYGTTALSYSATDGPENVDKGSSSLQYGEHSDYERLSAGTGIFSKDFY